MWTEDPRPYCCPKLCRIQFKSWSSMPYPLLLLVGGNAILVNDMSGDIERLGSGSLPMYCEQFVGKDEYGIGYRFAVCRQAMEWIYERSQLKSYCGVWHFSLRGRAFSESMGWRMLNTGAQRGQVNAIFGMR